MVVVRHAVADLAHCDHKEVEGFGTVEEVADCHTVADTTVVHS